MLRVYLTPFLGCKVDTFSDALAVECSIATVERMFNTEFAVYKHEKEGKGNETT